MEMEKENTAYEGVIRAKTPTKKETFALRIMITSGIFAVIIFLCWFFASAQTDNAWLFWLLTTALLFKVIKMLHEWYHYYGITPPPNRPPLRSDYKVDILTTACPGEPKDMIINTLKGIQNIRYPHKAYLCDEGDDPELREVCKELGVIHVTRETKEDAKAGNINNALKQADGEIAVILDPDHCPHPEFLHRVLPYFEDSKIGYVQSVQAYGNQKESSIALGAAEQTYHFYGPMMMCMSKYGTVQAIGANCAFRREALDSIGGHAAGLSEDMHTAMRIHAKGWKSIYVPEILTRGLVPGTISSYYKQQLKWSRGTFDLLFYKFPALFKNFTWRQKIHYATLPLYFLYGLITLIDILIPVMALFTAHVPWKVDLQEFAMLYAPVLAISLLIRQFSQRWLLEKHEHGFHLTGGFLRTGTWWIFLIGFIYTIFKVKVPYIPTPKDDKPSNNLKLGLPNLVMCLVSIIAIIYGLHIDWSPYSLFMAGLAGANCLILGHVFIISQERWLLSVKEKLYKGPLASIATRFEVLQEKIATVLSGGLRSGYASLLMIPIMLLGFSQKSTFQSQNLADFAPPEMKQTGGFYTGIYLSEMNDENNITPITNMESKTRANFDVVSFYQAWRPEHIEKFPMEKLRAISNDGKIAMITWEPWSSPFPEFQDHPDLGKDKKIFKAITEGKFDKFISGFAEKVREYGEPVFIRFAHEFDNPAYPWSASGGNSPEEFIAAWRYVVTVFRKMGVYNVSWVWSPWRAEPMYNYFPGGEYVDWVSITALNYGLASPDGKWRSFKEIYEPYRKKLLELKRPVMLAEFGSTDYGGDGVQWVNNALERIATDYDEIRSLIFFHTNMDKTWPTNWRPKNNSAFVDWTFMNEGEKKWVKALKKPPFNEHPFQFKAGSYADILENTSAGHGGHIEGDSGNFTFFVDGEPFYIKGIAYNTAHDWRDGKKPLTRIQVEDDIKKIKAMGANTIRRYDPGIYDRNVLNIAEKEGLKMIYGFWFDPKVDYYKDTAKVREYFEDVEKMVKRYKDNTAIIAWAVGNETWGILKHQFQDPYLTKVRNEYLRMIEGMTRLIHRLDPERPVMTALEHEEDQMPESIMAFNILAPSVDIIGINSYYEQQISTLNDIVKTYMAHRPYVASEFGPRGYWHPEYTLFAAPGVPIEENDIEKGKTYVHEWDCHVVAHKGSNLGGIAYCWSDRMEGSNTWFGLTDHKNRLKPSYFALKEAWTGEKQKSGLPRISIEGLQEKYTPGKRYKFKAATTGNYNGELEYKWYFFRDSYLEEMEMVFMTGSKRPEVEVFMPYSPENYRLYLYVSSGEIVTTVSEPVILEENNQIYEVKK